MTRMPKVGDCIVIEEDTEATVLSINDDGTVITNLATPYFREATLHHERSDNGDLKIETRICGAGIHPVRARQTQDGAWSFDWEATYAQATEESDERRLAE